jgi:hypothetical protein
MSEYSALSQFFMAFLNQDWLEEYGSMDSIAASFVRSNDEGTVTRVVGELSEVTHSARGEAELAKLAADLGAEYDPYVDHTTYAAWFPTLLAALKSARRSAKLD